jgi:hypothetical protein
MLLIVERMGIIPIPSNLATDHDICRGARLAPSATSVVLIKRIGITGIAGSGRRTVLRRKVNVPGDEHKPEKVVELYGKNRISAGNVKR